MAKTIHRPRKQDVVFGPDMDTLIKTNRLVPDKEFTSSIVQFEEDPFGLDKFLEKSKQHGGSNRPSDSSPAKEHEGVREDLDQSWGGFVGPHCCHQDSRTVLWQPHHCHRAKNMPISVMYISKSHWTLQSIAPATASTMLCVCL